MPCDRLHSGSKLTLFPLPTHNLLSPCASLLEQDDLDGAIAALSSPKSKSEDGGVAPSNPSSSAPLEDGPGTYNLVGLISHIGGDTSHGHYVAHLKKGDGGGWVIFNDESVALSESPPFKHAYLYLYRRKDGITDGLNRAY